MNIQLSEKERAIKSVEDPKKDNYKNLKRKKWIKYSVFHYLGLADHPIVFVFVISVLFMFPKFNDAAREYILGIPTWYVLIINGVTELVAPLVLGLAFRPILCNRIRNIYLDQEILKDSPYIYIDTNALHYARRVRYEAFYTSSKYKLLVILIVICLWFIFASMYISPTFLNAPDLIGKAAVVTLFIGQLLSWIITFEAIMQVISIILFLNSTDQVREDKIDEKYKEKSYPDSGYDDSIQIDKLKKANKILSIDNLEDLLKSTKTMTEKDLENSSLVKFHGQVRELGKSVFDLNIVFILSTLLPTVLAYIMYYLRATAFYFGNLILTAILATISLVISFLPQIKFHSLLKKAKEDTTSFYEDEMNRVALALTKRFKDEEKQLVSQTSKTKEEVNSIKYLKEEITFLKDQIEFTGGFGTWIYDFPALFKIVGAALSSFIPVLLGVFGISG